MNRYHEEDFVRGKIENWAGRPAGGAYHVLVVDEEEAARREVRAATSVVPIDHTDADITGRTLGVLGDQVAGVLIRYHTTVMALGKIAREVGVSYRQCRTLIEQGHVDFVGEWEKQKYSLHAELRRLAPAVDPSREAVGELCQERTKPRPSAVKIITPNQREAAPVLDYRKPATRAD